MNRRERHLANFVAELRRRNVLRVGAAYLVVAWIMLQMIDVIFPMFGLPDTLGRPVFLALLIGLPVALGLSWAFEWTPEGIKLDERVPDDLRNDPRVARGWDRAIIGVLVVAVGLLLVDKLVLSRASTPSPAGPVPAAPESEVGHSVAVLPFVNMSGRAENEYFSDGLTETLLHILAQQPQLKVAARTSAFAFKGKGVDIREVGQKLGVATVLEGSVQRSGDRVRITAQLIEAATGFHLWSETFDRKLEDIFAVQDEIAANVAQSLEITLLGQPAGEDGAIACVSTRSADAYETYLKAIAQKNTASYASFREAETLLERALVLDPEFSEAKVELAGTYMLEADTGLISEDLADSRARPLLAQVLAESHDHGRALGLTAVLDAQHAVRHLDSAGLRRAVQNLERAIELAANDSELHRQMARFMSSLGRHDAAVGWVDRGLTLDPMSAPLHRMRAMQLMHRGDLDRAEASMQRSVELEPGWTANDLTLARIAALRGNYAASMRHLHHAMDLDPNDHEIPVILARNYFDLGLWERGDAMLARARAIAPNSAVTRAVHLRKLLLTGKYVAAGELAAAMLRDRIEVRRESYSVAAFGYVSAMQHAGRESEVAHLFESLTPGIATADFVPSNLEEMYQQYALLFAEAPALPESARRARVQGLTETWDRWLPTWRKHGSDSPLALLAGDRERAVSAGLQQLRQGLAHNFAYRLHYFATSFMVDLGREPEIAAALAELEAEANSARTQIREDPGLPSP